MNDCLFCRILGGELPSACVYQDEHVYAFNDINPQADTHILVIPRTHIEKAADITPDTSALAARCFEAIPLIAKQQGLTDFRVVTNSGRGAGQSVFHLHFHILADSNMSNRHNWDKLVGG